MGLNEASTQSGLHLAAYSLDPTDSVLTYYDDISVRAGNSYEGPQYSLCLLYDQNKAVHSGASAPVKLQLCDSDGHNLSSPSLTLYATGITKVSDSITGPVHPPGNSA